MMMWHIKGVKELCVSLSTEDITPSVLCDITGGRSHLRGIDVNLE